MDPNIIAIIVSLLALGFSICTHFKYDKKLKKQQAQINDSIIKKNNLDEDNAKKANIEGHIEPFNKNGFKLIICNTGQATAKNVKVDIIGEKPAITTVNKDIGELYSKSECVALECNCRIMQDPDKLEVQYTWSDEFKSKNERKQTLLIR